MHNNVTVTLRMCGLRSSDFSSELKSYLAAVDFEARDGLSVDQFISVNFLPSFYL